MFHFCFHYNLTCTLKKPTKETICPLKNLEEDSKEAQNENRIQDQNGCKTFKTVVTIQL